MTEEKWPPPHIKGGFPKPPLSERIWKVIERVLDFFGETCLGVVFMYIAILFLALYSLKVCDGG